MSPTEQLCPVQHFAQEQFPGWSARLFLDWTETHPAFVTMLLATAEQSRASADMCLVFRAPCWAWCFVNCWAWKPGSLCRLGCSGSFDQNPNPQATCCLATKSGLLPKLPKAAT